MQASAVTNNDRVACDFDAVVIGGGITGMYMTYRLRQAGLSVRGIERNNDLGGTWAMNRYPGCRLDSESYTYAYSFLQELLADWDWEEEFATQPKLNEFFSRAADLMDIRGNYQFNTQVVKASYRESSNTWEIQLSNAEVIVTRFLFTAMGVLSSPKTLEVPGVNIFRGESYHSYYWPHERGGFGGQKADFSGKRVGVIGTGSTGVQIITEAAKTAGELYVFQRHPNWCVPLMNSPIAPDRMEDIRDSYQKIFAYCNSTISGFYCEHLYESAAQHSEEQRNAVLEKLYSSPGFGIWLGGYADLLTSKETNDTISEFVSGKIRQRVRDPHIAEKLIPKDHGFGLKRVAMESGYYETYNQENVHLVDLLEDPIQEITVNGLQTSQNHYELDVIIYATGFDAIVGAFNDISIKGRDGVTLKEAWANGPYSYLGLQIPGFPNLFTLNSLHNGATFCNATRCSEKQVDWVMGMVKHVVARQIHTVEAEPEAAKAWTSHCYDLVSNSLLAAHKDSYFWADFGGQKRFLFYFGGNPQFQEICKQIEDNGYEGFSLLPPLEPLKENSAAVGSDAVSQ